MRFRSLLCITLAVPLLRGSTDVQRLSPSSFPAAPKNVVDWLIKQDCTIPQAERELGAKRTTQANKLISGEFAAKGQKDWAALCSRKGSSSIVLLWGGKPACDGALAEGEDNLSMQQGVGGKSVYSRLISSVGREQILRRQKAFGGTVPAPLEHQGIDDIFVGKGSVTYYCHQGKWLKLQGAD